jgi:metal-responsive CopG/Arc/MetJ family transcriptional regulator
MSERTVKMKFATDLPVDLLTEFDEFCRERGAQKNQVTELALRRYMREEKSGG